MALATRRRIGGMAAAVLIGLTGGGCVAPLELARDDSATVLAEQALEAPNPASPGPFEVQTLYYGRRHRPASGQLVAGHTQSATDFTATGTVSYPVKGARVGASVTYVEERASGDDMGGVLFDLGAFKDLGRVSVMVGTFFDLAATAMVGWEKHLGLAAGAGVELSYLPLEGYGFALRMGFRRIRTDLSPHPWPLAIGASVGVDRFRVDLAVEASSGGGTVHRLGLRI